MVKKAPSTVSLDEAQKAMKIYIEQANRKTQLESEMNQNIANIKQEFEGDLKEAQVLMDTCEETIRIHTEANRETLLGKAKSADFNGGKIGYRLNPKSLGLLDGYDWPKVLARAKELAPECVFVKEELDKKGLINSAETLGTKLKRIGVEVVQEEVFFVKM